VKRRRAVTSEAWRDAVLRWGLRRTRRWWKHRKWCHSELRNRFRDTRLTQPECDYLIWHVWYDRDQTFEKFLAVLVARMVLRRLRFALDLGAIRADGPSLITRRLPYELKLYIQRAQNGSWWHARAVLLYFLQGDGAHNELVLAHLEQARMRYEGDSDRGHRGLERALWLLKPGHRRTKLTDDPVAEIPAEFKKRYEEKDGQWGAEKYAVSMVAEELRISPRSVRQVLANASSEPEAKGDPPSFVANTDRAALELEAAGLNPAPTGASVTPPSHSRPSRKRLRPRVRERNRRLKARGLTDAQIALINRDAPVRSRH
jgi:hypothetical protein